MLRQVWVLRQVHGKASSDYTANGSKRFLGAQLALCRTIVFGREQSRVNDSHKPFSNIHTKLRSLDRRY